MDEITVELPEELQDQVANWKDGQQYQVTLTQTGPGQFTMASVDNENAGDDDEGSDDMSPGSTADTGGTTIPTTNPAIASLIGRRK